MGVGSDFQRGMQAATAALQGLAGGDITQAAAGAAAPYLAQLIKQQTPEGPSRVMAHALVLGALAAAQNKNAMVSATGAATGELVGMLATELYHKEASQLTEGEKETVSTLATLAAGLAGGLTGADGTDVLASAQTGKTVVENNLLAPGAGDIGFWLGKTPECDSGCKAGIAKGIAEGNLVVSAGLAGVAGGAMIVAATPEVVAAAKLALEGCKAAPVICLNNAGLQVAEAITPGGIGATGVIGIGKTAVEAAVAKSEAVAAHAVRHIELPTGTVFDSIKSTQAVYPGSVIPKSFEMSLPNGQKIWVHGNATKHMAEYAASKSVMHTPEAVRLASQEELRSFQAAMNSATKNGMQYGNKITVDGWQLEIKPPRLIGELPTVIHARYLGAN